MRERTAPIAGLSPLVWNEHLDARYTSSQGRDGRVTMRGNTDFKRRYMFSLITNLWKTCWHDDGPPYRWPQGTLVIGVLTVLLIGSLCFLIALIGLNETTVLLVMVDGVTNVYVFLPIWWFHVSRTERHTRGKIAFLTGILFLLATTWRDWVVIHAHSWQDPVIWLLIGSSLIEVFILWMICRDAHR